MKLTIQPLEADLKFARAHLDAAPANQFWRRTVIRCLLALAEALLWNLRQVIPMSARTSGNSLTPQDLEDVLEIRTVTKNGRIETHNNFLKFRDSVKLTFELYGKVHGFAFKLKYGAEFDSLCKTYELRSRLMHPKVPFDLGVSEENMATAQSGADWFLSEYWRLIEEWEEAVKGMKNSKQ